MAEDATTGEGDIHAVSVALLRDGCFLLVRRAQPPARGQYAFPGGRVEPGESAEEAARRELLEETGLEAGELAPATEIVIEAGDRCYRLEVFSGMHVSGRMEAGDDADHAGWYTVEEMRAMPVTESTLAVAERIAAAAGSS